jgi:hypothetical protein
MRYKTPLGRLGAACAATSLVALAAATPARAAEPGDFAWVQPYMEYVVNIATDATTPKPVKITIENSAPTTATDVTVKIDASAVPAAFQLDLPDVGNGCTVAGKVATCALDGLAGNSTHVYTVDALPGDLDVLEYQGLIEVTTTAANMPEEQRTEGWVQLWEPGVDLVVGEIDDMTLEPGQSATVPVRAGNAGTVKAAGVEVILAFAYNLELPDLYDNCDYNADFHELTCWILDEVAPGEVFTIAKETPLRVKVEDEAPGPDRNPVWVRVMPLGDEESEQLAAKAQRSAGKQLRIAAVPVPELNDFDNFTEFHVNVPKQLADAVAIGGTASGAAGDTVGVTVAMRNDGPNNQLGYTDEWGSSARVTLPAGVQPVAVPENCAPIVDGHPDWDRAGKPFGLVYHCWPTNSLVVGETFEFPFRVKIVDTAGAAGSIAVDGGVQDPDTANNTAEITVGAGGGGGGLPVTGARAGLVAGVGALLVAAGALAVVLLRRRRIVTVVD